MRTISITVDDEVLELIERILSDTSRFANRSALIRDAIRAFAASERKRQQEDVERQILRRNREQLAQEARALIDGQADS